jgi:dihydrofolate reductase
MGRTTYETIGRVMPGRVIVVMSRREVAGALPLSELKSDTKEGVFVSDLQPADLLQQLIVLGREQVVIAGGSSIYSQFLKENLIEDIFITIEPVIFGAGVKLFNQELYKKLTLIDIKRISDQSTVFHLKVDKDL